MTSPEQIRKERIEEVFSHFENTEVKMIDPILWKTKTLYPFLRDATAKEYALAVMRMLEIKQFEVKQKEVGVDGKV